jgi:aspartate/glutamate racemase
MIHTVIPHESYQREISACIDRILIGEICKSDALTLENMIVHLKEKSSIQGIILGCTELSVLQHRYPLRSEGITFFDPLQILAECISGGVTC